jgi:cell fate regulator YaaT (PSP1 superfamily)
MAAVALVRYGAVPEVARFEYALDELGERGQSVVVLSHRGPELGTVLEIVRTERSGMSGGNSRAPDDPPISPVMRAATAEDQRQHEALRQEAQSAFSGWRERIRAWGLDLELIDVEWTLDREKLVLYVLGGRGPDTTKLALQAAAEGLTVIEVQPVSADGVVSLPSGGGGCGSGGCGCHD